MSDEFDEQMKRIGEQAHVSDEEKERLREQIRRGFAYARERYGDGKGLGEGWHYIGEPGPELI